MKIRYVPLCGNVIYDHYRQNWGLWLYLIFGPLGGNCQKKTTDISIFICFELTFVHLGESTKWADITPDLMLVKTSGCARCNVIVSYIYSPFTTFMNIHHTLWILFLGINKNPSKNVHYHLIYFLKTAYPSIGRRKDLAWTKDICSAIPSQDYYE